MVKRENFIERAYKTEKIANREKVHHPHLAPNYLREAAQDWLEGAKFAEKTSDKIRYLKIAIRDYEDALQVYNLEERKIKKFNLEEERKYPLKLEDIDKGMKETNLTINKVKKTLETLTKKSREEYSNNLKNHYPYYKSFLILSVLSFLVALFFLSFNITGFVVSYNNIHDFKWLGSCFFICGLTFTFLYFINKNK